MTDHFDRADRRDSAGRRDSARRRDSADGPDRCAVCGRRTGAEPDGPPGRLIVRIKPVRLVLCDTCYQDPRRRGRFVRIVRRTREQLRLFYQRLP